MYGVRKSHLIGILAGALLGVLLSGVASRLGLGLAAEDGLLWGAAIGGVLAGLPQFAESGAILTRNPDSVWNPIVGLLCGLVIIGAMAGLVIALWMLLS
jgi:hypothetical protein